MVFELVKRCGLSCPVSLAVFWCVVMIACRGVAYVVDDEDLACRFIPFQRATASEHMLHECGSCQEP